MLMQSRTPTSLVLPLLGLILVLQTAFAMAASPETGEWPSWGGSAAGQRFSPLREITTANVAKLELAWTYRHGDASGPTSEHGPTAFEASPIVVGDTLYFCTPYNRVIALDAERGTMRWRFDPQVRLRGVLTPTCRGVSFARIGGTRAGEPCASRIFLATLDARLIALDAVTGTPCVEFGNAGGVDLRRGLGDVRDGEYYATSPPLVVGGAVVSGAAVRDGARADAPGGAVRAFDARTGALRWTFDPVPPGTPAPGSAAASGTATRRAPNAWAPMSADEALGLLYVPTGNPAPDHFAGEARGGLAHFGSSVVALDVATGQVRWHFQTVHQDLWDYDVPAQPVLYTHRGAGGPVPALAVVTKTGHVYLLDRRTGAPLFPVEERAVPASSVPGERAAATQPFPTRPAPLHPQGLRRDDVWGLTPWDRDRCLEEFDRLDARGMYTPPSTRGTVVYPGMGGGINWGSVSIDPAARRLVANLQRVPFVLRLIPRDQAPPNAPLPDTETYRYVQEGAPYAAVAHPFLSPLGVPCVAPPWGEIVAIDLDGGEVSWRRALGDLRSFLPLGLGRLLDWGTPNLGGTLQTAGGVTFVGATLDAQFRALDSATGRPLWSATLPFPGIATPVTYRTRPGGRQFVVIAAGGHGAMGTATGDTLVAFALP